MEILLGFASSILQCPRVSSLLFYISSCNSTIILKLFYSSTSLQLSFIAFGLPLICHRPHNRLLLPYVHLIVWKGYGKSGGDLISTYSYLWSQTAHGLFPVFGQRWSQNLCPFNIIIQDFIRIKLLRAEKIPWKREEHHRKELR